MDLASQFGAIVIQDRVSILGVRLVPISIGHAILLERLQSPFSPMALGSKPANLGDLILALYVCSRPWNAAETRLQTIPAAVAVWWIRLRYTLLLSRQKAEAAQLIAAAKLGDYVRASTIGPKFWRKAGDGGKRQAPFLQSLLIHRMETLHQSWADALSTPLRLAIWDMVAWAESKGSISMISQAEQEIIDRVNAESEARN